MKPEASISLVRRAAVFLALLCFAAPAAAKAPAIREGEPARAGSAKALPGQFSLNDLPAERDGASLLTIPAPGRYAIRAKSASGARIELIDMIAGPLDSSGAAGLRDGRIDALLDKGVYKMRVFNAKGASGKVRLSAEPFIEAETRTPELAPGRVQSAELGDLAQRSFALDVGPSGRVGVEAVGRALQDLRLWRADGEPVDIGFEKAPVEPRPGHFMTRARLDGSVPPGRYVVTAYGGEKLVWSDAAAAQPLHLRIVQPQELVAGVAEGVIGPFGGERYEAPADYDSFRLELPQPADARLDARRGGGRERAAIGKTSREPVATIGLATDGKSPARLEVSGYEGQSFSLRAIHRDNRLAFEASGPHLVSIDVAGEGGDDLPATALFARIERDGRTRVLASDMPRVVAGRAWRGKFNLRGPSSILFEAASHGVIAIDAKGPKIRATIEPALGALAPRADGRDPMRYDLQAGFYLLTLAPVGDAAGVVDVTLGTPGVSAPLPAPARATISFGEQKLEKDGSYLILANVAPGLLTGPRVVELPADLEKAPLALRQPAKTELAVPIRLPKTGAVAARDSRGADVALALADERSENDARFATVKIAPVEKERALGLVFVPEPAKKEEAATGDEPGKSPHAAPIASVGKAAFFDLARDEAKQARFDVSQGGLYRIETLGRLQTALTVGTSFAPRLGQGENNGPGHNGLVTAYLRAGAYRASVTARESAGRVGLSVSPSALVTTVKLSDDGIARVTLDSGKGAAVPFEITRDGLYRLELLGVNRDWNARLEDADGWPLAAPGKLARLTRRFETGNYRLVVMPQDVEARMIARLVPVVPAPTLEGHGPHELPFETARKLQWREPQDRSAPRAPDVWRFSLLGDADVEIAIGEGMAGEIVKGENETVGKVVDSRKFKGRLGAGAYRVEARSLAHDDRLDYGISLSSKELQPGAPRFVELPAKLAFSIAKDAIVDLTSLGEKEMLGALKDENGAVIERLQGRADDWNVALSRRLPAGAYTLELEPLGADPHPASEESSADEDEESAASDETAAPDGQEADQGDEPRERGVEIRLAIPEERSAGALAASGETALDGDGAHLYGAHVFSLPPAPDGSLALVAAQSASEIALSIETRDAGGAWRVIGTERGSAPVAAWPADKSDNNERRAVVWTVGGGKAPIAVAGRIAQRRGRAAGDIALKPVDGLAAPICVGLASIPGASLVDVVAPPSGLAAGSAPGRLLHEARSGPLAPQSGSLWLLSRGDCGAPARVSAFAWKGDEIALDIGAGETAELPPLEPPPGKARLWLARSAFGQPGLDAGRGMSVAGMAVAEGTALALAGDKPLRLWNVSGAAPLRLTLRAIDATTLPAAQGDRRYAAVIPPRSAQPVSLSASDAPLALDLAPGVAAFSAPDAARAFSAFGDDAPVARVQHGANGKIWLVNLSDKPAPARVSVEPGKSETLPAGRGVKRFYGAGGRLALRTEAQKGDRLMVIGGGAVYVSDAGRVTRGDAITLDGPGEAIIEYEPGLVGFWLERESKSPWPATTPRAIATPYRVALGGEAMGFTLNQPAPVMLDVRSSAPAIVAFSQNGRREIRAYAAGVEFHRYMNAGDARLDVYSPHDGALAGTLDVSAQPVIAAHEGVNDEVAVSPGASVLFSFETTREGEIGIGLRAEPDRALMRLLDADGRTLGEGVAQAKKLAPGRYFVEARVPADAPASVLRLAVVGVSPPPAGPPPELVAEFLEKAGLKTTKTR